MFERFTQDARTAVAGAQDEARRLRHPSIRPEHVLIALAGSGGAAAQVLLAHGLDASALRERLLIVSDGGLDTEALASLGIDLDEVRKAADVSLGPGVLDRAPRPPVRDGHIPFSKPGKKLLELALREAVQLKSKEIRTGHLLLGIIRGGDATAIDLLRSAQIDLDALRLEVTDAMSARAA